MTAQDTRKASASPTKSFFVRMITRDIGLDDCILDLIDNSVDGAWRLKGGHLDVFGDDKALDRFHIEIEASEDRFSIRDNCGGMTLDDAAEHAFTFGRKETVVQADATIGVYGIGMKRAVFKLGGDILVRSTFLEKDGTRASFAVPIVVEDWLKDDDPPWDFDIVEAAHLPRDGVEIVVTKLSSGSSSSFSDAAFVEDLKRTVARDYSLQLRRGLRISINGTKILGWPLQLRRSEDYEPMRAKYDDEGVHVQIIGGMAAAPPDDSGPDDAKDGDRRFGWYVACNGRIVLAADKSAVSGWGTMGWPRWHYQYSGFIGFVIFTGPASALPLTTTKRSVDVSSEVFRRARPRMRDVSKRWIAYTNQRKYALAEAKRREAEAITIPLDLVDENETGSLPSLSEDKLERPANVNYPVPLKRLKRLAGKLGDVNMSYRDVGTKTFDYAYDDLVGDD